MRAARFRILSVIDRRIRQGGYLPFAGSTDLFTAGNGSLSA